MQVYINDSNDPHFNLAAEEYLLESQNGDAFWLWRNSPCVVIGKNQNAHAEIDMQYVRENDIIVVRRNSGGGAVFHDLGNVNYSYITDSGGEVRDNFRSFTAPVVEALRNLGLPAAFSGRNDIEIDGCKVSGNAQYYRGGRVLHHGTLLYDGNLTMLAGALNPDRKKLQAKGVESVRSRVANISSFLQDKRPVEWFMEYLLRSCAQSAGQEPLRFDDRQIDCINKLCESKYRTWKWNFGSAPRFDYTEEKRFAGGTVCLQLAMRDGIIRNARFSGDYFGKKDCRELSGKLRGVRFERRAMENALQAVDTADYFAGVTKEELLELFPG